MPRHRLPTDQRANYANNGDKLSEFNSILIFSTQTQAGLATTDLKEVAHENAFDEDIMASFGVSKAIEKSSSFVLD